MELNGLGQACIPSGVCLYRPGSVFIRHSFFCHRLRKDLYIKNTFQMNIEKKMIDFFPKEKFQG